MLAQDLGLRYNPHAMGKRLENADSRRFFDEFACVKASFFRGRDVIDPKLNHATIPWPDGRDRVIATKHTWFKTGGGWSYFVCPGCARRVKHLWLIGEAPRCCKCCNAMNIAHRSKYGFGSDERIRARDAHLDRLQAKLETTAPLTHKPRPGQWRGKLALMHSSIRLSERARRNIIQLRLASLANEQQGLTGKLKLTRSYRPRADTREIPELQQVWKARTYEQLEQALDKAQCVILKALEGQNQRQRMAAVRIMLRTKAARERGW